MFNVRITPGNNGSAQPGAAKTKDFKCQPMKVLKDNKLGPLVTVLISTYNRPRYLRQALDSIFRQTWPNIEIILVRDGGLPVRDAIAEYLDDPRLTFIDRSQNCGLPYSFNEALSRARGEYICYLGDDDIFYPFHVQTLLEAMLSQDRCQVVYGDLYKSHCRVTPDGRRVVLAKNVEISRDFDRMLMLQFNHALHVSLMHRRDLLDKAGPYNEKLNVLIDWDLTRRLCFYSDFLHVPVVTGEYYAPVGDSDRISVQRRKNVNEYLWNLLTIRSTRPAKPWSCMSDLSVIVLADRADAQLEQTLNNLWSHTFYPNQYYVPLPPSEHARFSIRIPNVISVATEPGACAEEKIDRILSVCEGDYIAIVPVGLRISPDEVSFLERSLYPLLQNRRTDIAYELVEATPQAWGAVFPAEALKAARRAYPELPLQESVRAAGITLQKPQPEQFPFMFDNYLAVARQQERDGNWKQAVCIYEYLSEHFGNDLWMQTLKANALLCQGRWDKAAVLAERMNRTRPTIARLMIEARARHKIKDYSAAVALYRRAEAILDGNSTGYPQDRPDAVTEGRERSAPAAPRAQESLQWTS
jgi:glycosyltransferase involved in cell wall biosynthesis